MTTDEHAERIRKARTSYDRARNALFREIKAALDAGVGPSEVARSSGYTREYVARIRDGKGPKR